MGTSNFSGEFERDAVAASCRCPEGTCPNRNSRIAPRDFSHTDMFYRLRVVWFCLIWLREQDLNLRPSGYEPDELPGCSIPRQWVCFPVWLIIVERYGSEDLLGLAMTYSPTF